MVRLTAVVMAAVIYPRGSNAGHLTQSKNSPTRANIFANLLPPQVPTKEPTLTFFYYERELHQSIYASVRSACSRPAARHATRHAVRHATCHAACHATRHATRHATCHAADMRHAMQPACDMPCSRHATCHAADMRHGAQPPCDMERADSTFFSGTIVSSNRSVSVFMDSSMPASPIFLRSLLTPFPTSGCCTYRISGCL